MSFGIVMFIVKAVDVDEDAIDILKGELAHGGFWIDLAGLYNILYGGRDRSPKGILQGIIFVLLLPLSCEDFAHACVYGAIKAVEDFARDAADACLGVELRETARDAPRHGWIIDRSG